MDEPSTPRRTRSRGFPVVPLSDAARIARKAGTYGRRHPTTAFAGYMGHETVNSGAFKQNFAALRAWGLVKVEGDYVVLTDLATTLAHPMDEESTQSALREAFKSATVFAQLFETSAKGTDLSIDRLANTAVVNLQISPTNKARFIRSFVSSVVTAGLGEEAGPGRIRLLPDPAKPAEPGADVEAPGDELEEPAARRQDSGHNASGAPTLRQVWPVAGGFLAFEARIARPLPAEAFSDLAGIFGEVEQLVAKLESLGSPEATAQGES